MASRSELQPGDQQPQPPPANGQSASLPVTVLDVHRGKPVRLQVKVVVPTNDHPNYNFVGKLLGPKGNSLKWLQERTQTKMAILGRGSMRNKEKEDELRARRDPKYAHLNEDLHVEITAYAPAPEAYQRISNALFEIKRFLVPDYYDEIRKQQLRELGVITVDSGGGGESNGSFSLFSTAETSPVGGPVSRGESTCLSSYSWGSESSSDISAAAPSAAFWPPAQPAPAVASPVSASISRHLLGSHSSAVPFKVQSLAKSALHGGKPYARPVRNS